MINANNKTKPNNSTTKQVKLAYQKDHIYIYIYIERERERERETEIANVSFEMVEMPRRGVELAS